MLKPFYELVVRGVAHFNVVITSCGLQKTENIAVTKPLHVEVPPVYLSGHGISMLAAGI